MKGVESNARLTAATAAVLLVLLAAEGVTILRIGQHVNLHVFLGMVLIPPVVLKIGSTGWRFYRYYRGSPEYRRKGPPPLVLRLLGPVVVVTTVVMFATGVALLVPSRWKSDLLFLHKASFVLWFASMTVHVLGHLGDTARLVPLDWARRTRRAVPGSGARFWLLTLAVVAGVVLAALTWNDTGGFGGAHPGQFKFR